MVRGFNGATSFQKWIDIVMLCARSDGVCFNGATSFQKWIEGGLWDYLMTPPGFQWSHFLSEMDRGHFRINMRPILLFQWSHFLSEMDSCVKEGGMDQRWSVSMEPLPFRNG